MRLDEPDPKAAWDERFAELSAHAAALNELRLDALELPRAGHRAHDRPAPVVGVDGRRLHDARRAAPPPEPAVGGDLHRARSGARRRARHLDAPARAQGRHDRARACASASRAAARSRSTRTRTSRRCARRSRATTAPPGSARSRSSTGRAGSGRTGTIFFDTLLDENAASHIALGGAYRFSVEDEADRARLNTSAIHVDFMIGSEALEVTGITRDGERVPVMRGGDWTLGIREPYDAHPMVAVPELIAAAPRSRSRASRHQCRRSRAPERRSAGPRHRDGEGRGGGARRGRRPRRRHRQAHRALGRGQVRRARAWIRRAHLVGHGEQAARARELRGPAREGRVAPRRARPLRRRRLRRRRPAAPAVAARRHAERLPRAVRPDHVHPPGDEELDGFTPDAVVLHAPERRGRARRPTARAAARSSRSIRRAARC